MNHVRVEVGKSTRDAVANQRESASFKISSIVQTWSLIPDAIAGVLGYGLASVL